LAPRAGWERDFSSDFGVLMLVALRLVAFAFVACILTACESAPEGLLTSADPAGATESAGGSPGTSARAAVGDCDFSSAQQIDVSDAGELAAALASARAGTLIRLAPGTYGGRFAATAEGTSSAPIILCGPRSAILDGGSTATGYVLHLDGAKHWILSGFTVTRGKNGVMLDGASHNILTGLFVHDLGQTGVHLRRFSTDNLIERSDIRDTGREQPGTGEGVYIGTAATQWADASGDGAEPDRSDRNRVIDNVIGPGVTAEAVDAKEGTTGGEIRDNTFDGASLSGVNGGDSWVDMKGNGYVVAGNTGADAPVDGFQVHVVASGWGRDNVFSANVASVNGSGYGFRVAPEASGTTVLCDNAVQNAAQGFANVACNAPASSSSRSPSKPPSENFDLSHWYLTLPSGSTVSVAELNSGYQRADVFYTDSHNGGMVFHCPNRAGTTENSHYSRTELREMLDPENTSTRDDSNNWTTADGGTLTARLRVDHVSTTGDSDKVGRVIIGQIHGADSEPIRLYFDKKPGETRGRIYAAHDTASNSSSFSRDIVGNAGDAGIALGETFSYRIRLVDVHLTVQIRTASGAVYDYARDIDPAYRGENLYFKAGVYNQNNTGDSADYVKATFFALTHAHP
jgi:hypothetical protein